MEQDFSERLKKYRREKNLTQQELADLLQVSNKTVSRWESGGGYPDVPMLVPLARALGVSVDDLLDGKKPVRTLTRADWQSLLSFAFALGGGVCFYLLDLFMPMLVCYLAYLGCMAYGIYLQRHYCYQSRWFRIGNAVMNFSVNVTLVGKCAVTALTLSGMGDPSGVLRRMLTNQMPALLLAALGILAGGAVLTAITLYLAERRGLGTLRGLRLVFRVRGGGFGRFVPAVGMGLLTAFWGVFLVQNLPLEVYLDQKWIYWGLFGVLLAVCVVLSCKKGRRMGFVPTAALLLGGPLLPGLARQYAWLENSRRFVEVTGKLSERYPRFGVISPGLVATGAVFFFLCVLLAVMKLERKTEEKTEN
ncbi:helix-turn-helix domain-containing protein [Pseudoflavonifractor sp. BIOML-A6]|nr:MULTISPECIES: helix-turn-helix transcriptional regulator [unclassified Pseudoflavonifractor]MTQ97286.1 helix-turn-helix domain-containing protein [Pseudoflavonifractor sp. BIOML-A16]MTR05325.1 helix-turn-helix domain-containing protein [Pseudoflavonifractor sp. BIOML-A15]MTR31591.1 helix-turn-helix domain-containing protein [Pseudoflavonifractor sp. BIOML-A14]MTR72277.1 helix-turn-helix domain-containing protein [Pseudoflavonifractor sp. BIOML-A18]MTS62983.1 helix-turn-helix domain-containi